MNVQVICTTDDPLDDLQYHKKISESNFAIKVLPAFRPDKAMNVADAEVFNNYVNKLEAVADIEINDFDKYHRCIKKTP